MLLLPVFGYPMKHTEICFREECKEENWRRREMRVPLPKLLVRLAWKARVGYSRLRSLTQRACEKSLVSCPDLGLNI